MKKDYTNAALKDLSIKSVPDRLSVLDCPDPTLVAFTPALSFPDGPFIFVRVGSAIGFAECEFIGYLFGDLAFIIHLE